MNIFKKYSTYSQGGLPIKDLSSTKDLSCAPHSNLQQEWNAFWNYLICTS